MVFLVQFNFISTLFDIRPRLVRILIIRVVGLEIAPIQTVRFQDHEARETDLIVEVVNQEIGCGD